MTPKCILYAFEHQIIGNAKLRIVLVTKQICLYFKRQVTGSDVKKHTKHLNIRLIRDLEDVRTDV